MMTLGCTTVAGFALTLVAGCARPGGPEPQREAAAPATPQGPTASFVTPVTYTGRLPCVDCPGIRLTVTLLPDSTFRLRRIYEDRGGAFHRLGRWSLEGRGTRLILRAGKMPPRRFVIAGRDSLHLLDPSGRVLQAGYSLSRHPRVDLIRETMVLSGMYVYMADAGRMTECMGGTTYPVAQLGANATLEQAYGGAQGQPGAPVLVSFDGHFEALPGMDGGGRVEHIVVDRVDRVWPGTTCARRMSDVTPENSYWTLLELGGRAVRVVGHAPEPNLRLNPGQRQARGSTGCNGFVGPYRLNGDSLSFGALAATRRACIEAGLHQQESVFLQALADTRTWRVAGDTLVLSGAAGDVARFAAQ
jgi:heat shock protein HslJ